MCTYTSTLSGYIHHIWFDKHTCFRSRQEKYIQYLTISQANCFKSIVKVLSCVVNAFVISSLPVGVIRYKTYRAGKKCFLINVDILNCNFQPN